MDPIQLSMVWVNYNDLTATSLQSWLVREIIPKWPYFRLVNYYNLPRMADFYGSHRVPFF
jgi:hypothetical protein